MYGYKSTSYSSRGSANVNNSGCVWFELNFMDEADQQHPRGK